MKRHPSRFRRLDGALADLPVEEPMLLTELDGFLTGLVVCPEAYSTGRVDDGRMGRGRQWYPAIRGTPLDVQWFATAVSARRDEIARDLARSRLQPILDVDERDGEVLWEYWVDGFAEAISLRPEVWEALAKAPDASATVAAPEDVD